MLDRLDSTEQVTLVLTAVFVTTLGLTAQIASPIVWALWGAVMVLLTGTVLVVVNRVDTRT